MGHEWSQFVNRHGGKVPTGKSTVVDFQYSAGLAIKSPQTNLEFRPRDDGEAAQMAVVLSPPQVTPFALGLTAETVKSAVDNLNTRGVAFSNPYAEVEWGSGGVANLVECDISNGLVLNISGSYCRVRVGVDEVGFDTGRVFYTLQCFVGPGYPKSNNAQRSYQNVTWNVGLSAMRATPRFAKSVSVVGVGAPLGVVINFYRNFAGSNAVCSYAIDNQHPGPFPVPNGAYYWQLDKSAGNADMVSAVFDLAV